MRRNLRLIALTLAFAAVGFWLATGGHRGWTKTSVAVKTVDEVTGLEGIRYERRFVPGLDFLAGGLLGAGVLAGISFLIRNQHKTEN